MSTARLLIVASFVLVVYGLFESTGQQAPAASESTEEHLQQLPGNYKLYIETGSEAEPGQVYTLQGVPWTFPESGGVGSQWGEPITMYGLEFQALAPGVLTQPGEGLGTFLPVPQHIASVPGAIPPLAFSPNAVVVELTAEQLEYLDHLVATALSIDPQGQWDRGKIIGGLIDSAMKSAVQSGQAADQD